MKHFIGKAALAACAAVAMGPAYASVVGEADSTGTWPFGANAYLGGYYFQQVYSASIFDSAFDINSLSFYSTAGGTPNTGTYRISIGATNAAIDTFDTSDGTVYPWNPSSLTVVYEDTLPALVDGRLDFNLSEAFHYDPSQGNLLVSILNLGLSSDGSLLLDVDSTTSVTNSRFSAYPYDWNQGLVTGFNEVAPVPLPAGLWLLGSGLAGLGALRRKRGTAA